MVKPAILPGMGGVELTLFDNRPVISQTSFSLVYNHL